MRIDLVQENVQRGEPVEQESLSVAFVHHSGGVEVFEQSVESFHLVPFAPAQGIVFQPAVSPYGLVLVTELDNALSDVERTADSCKETVPAGVVVFNELLQDQPTSSSWTPA